MLFGSEWCQFVYYRSFRCGCMYSIQTECSAIFPRSRWKLNCVEWKSLVGERVLHTNTIHGRTQFDFDSILIWTLNQFDSTPIGYLLYACIIFNMHEAIWLSAKFPFIYHLHVVIRCVCLCQSFATYQYIVAISYPLLLPRRFPIVITIIYQTISRKQKKKL